MLNSLTNLDYILIIFGIFSFYSGWRRGFIMGFTSILGVGLGILIANTALQVGYGASTGVDTKRVTITTLVFIAGIAMGSIFGFVVAAFIQKILIRGPLKFVNKFAGSGFSFLTVSLVVWLISGYLVALPNTSINDQINESTVITKLDEVAPDELREYLDKVKAFVIDSQLPQVAVDAIIGPEVAPPDPVILENENIANALASVVRIESISEECNVRMSGSGFVIADNLVVTNAHVVAGITTTKVRVGGKGKSVTGTITYFDPNVDIALIKTTKLTAPALKVGDELKRSEMGVVAGFPGGGSLTLIPARVSEIAKSIDSNIYGTGQVTRELYVLKADVKQGDSGAALINDLGQVSGVIFAASAAESNIGYALTVEELQRALTLGQSLTESTDTGKCIPIE
ncbi:MAG: hypothetical protein RIS61_967 [Actinomycetota bacterium]